jgi:transcriptional regulator with XRE-family HTH domain
MELKKDQIGIRFKTFRKRIKKKRKDIVALTSQTYNVVKSIENGISAPSSKLLIVLYREYNLNINWLLTGNGSMFVENVMPVETGETLDDFREFKFYMENVPFVRYEVLKYFSIFKWEQKERIERYLKEKGIKWEIEMPTS